MWQVVTTPGASCNVHDHALNMLILIHYNYTGVLWNFQRILQHIQNIKFDTQIDEFGQFRSSFIN